MDDNVGNYGWWNGWWWWQYVGSYDGLACIQTLIVGNGNYDDDCGYWSSWSISEMN